MSEADRFRDDVHRARACHALCEPIRLARRWTPELWTNDGPTPYALAVKEGRERVDLRDRIIILVAFAFWRTGSALVTLDQIIAAVLLEDVTAIAGLMVASRTSAAAIDAWIEQRPRAPRRPSRRRSLGAARPDFGDDGTDREGAA
jgi:hypothetical protein